MAMLPEHDGVVTMTIAEQLKAFYANDINSLIDDAQSRCILTKTDDDDGTIEFDFIDGSVLVVYERYISAYGSRY